MKIFMKLENKFIFLLSGEGGGLRLALGRFGQDK